MYVHPCRHCPKFKECEQYQAVLKAGRESSVRMYSCRIKCEGFPESIFPPGTRVQAQIKIVDCECEYPETYTSISSGTVMAASSRRDKLLVHIDHLEGESDAIRHLYPSSLTLLDEPPVALCPGCGLPVDVATRPKEDWYCECDVSPRKRRNHCLSESGYCKWIQTLPYPCQTVAMIVEDL